MSTYGAVLFHPQEGIAIDLKPLRSEDTDHLQQMLSYPEVRHHILLRCGAGSKYKYFDKLVNRMINTFDPSELHAGIYLKGRGRLIGTVSLQNWNRRERKASLGYMVDPAWWGFGLATEAVGLLLNYAVHELEVTRVEGRCRGNNCRSERVMIKNGMKLERVLPKVGEIDDVMKIFTFVTQMK